jgi:hypothetical protein
VSAVREGMAKVIPVPLLSLFSGYELETMVCGSPDIPLNLLKSVATYKGKGFHVHEIHEILLHFSTVLLSSELVVPFFGPFYSLRLCGLAISGFLLLYISLVFSLHMYNMWKSRNTHNMLAGKHKGRKRLR